MIDLLTSLSSLPKIELSQPSQLPTKSSQSTTSSGLPPKRPQIKSNAGSPSKLSKTLNQSLTSNTSNPSNQSSTSESKVNNSNPTNSSNSSKFTKFSNKPYTSHEPNSPNPKPSSSPYPSRGVQNQSVPTEQDDDKLKDQKVSLILYLESLDVIRPGTVDIDLLLSICRTGVLYADLINRLEGRSEVIKGVERNPKNRTQALSNLTKSLEYLRSQEKMSSRFLWSGKEIVEGRQEAICGLLADIKALYTRPRVLPRPLNKSFTQSPSSSFTGKNEESSMQESFLKGKSTALRSYSASMKRTPTPSVTSKLSRPGSSKTAREASDPTSFRVSDKAKRTVLDWLEALGIGYVATSNPYTDRLSNGLVLCELARVLEGDCVKSNPTPRSTRLIQENFERSLQVFICKREISRSFLANSKNLASNPEIVFAFLQELMKHYSKAVSIEYQDHPLPYGALGISRLEKSITRWVASMKLIQPDPENFHELVPEIKSGVLLCVVVCKVFSVKIRNIVRNPRTELSIMANIRKALEVLRKVPQMSQKYLYSAKEVFKGSAGVILGLFEDLHRCANGLPARKSGDEYYKDGPYLPREIKV